MPQQNHPNSGENGDVEVFIYEPELNFLKWLVLEKPKIETGGDLFGLWQDENTAVVQLILGPGKKCKRTSTSFHQDVGYLGEIGGYLTSSFGLCNIGQWHSHHTLGLAEPSVGDLNTVWNHMPSVAGGKFLVFIANIKGTPQKVNIGCFLFNSSTQKMITGSIKCLQYPSPLRLTVDNTYLTSGAENEQIKARKRSTKKQTRTAKKVERTTSNARNNTTNGTNEESSSEERDEEDTLLEDAPEKQELSVCGRIRQLFVRIKNFVRNCCC